jgi:hypothetical protein
MTIGKEGAITVEGKNIRYIPTGHLFTYSGYIGVWENLSQSSKVKSQKRLPSRSFALCVFVAKIFATKTRRHKEREGSLF